MLLHFWIFAKMYFIIIEWHYFKEFEKLTWSFQERNWSLIKVIAFKTHTHTHILDLMREVWLSLYIGLIIHKHILYLRIKIIVIYLKSCMVRSVFKLLQTIMHHKRPCWSCVTKYYEWIWLVFSVVQLTCLHTQCPNFPWGNCLLSGP